MSAAASEGMGFGKHDRCQAWECASGPRQAARLLIPQLSTAGGWTASLWPHGLSLLALG